MGAPEEISVPQESVVGSVLREILYLLLKIVAIAAAFVVVFTFVFGVLRYSENAMLPAVKDAGRLEACLAQPAGVVFLLCGDILNIDRLIDRVHQAGKYAVVHADLVAGLAPREIAVDFLHRCGADGIISTRCCAVAGSWVC